MVPEGWESTDLGRVVARFVGGGTPDRRNPEFWHGTIPWASVKDLGPNRIGRTQEFISEEGLRASAATLLPAGTIVLATRMAVGRAGLATVDLAINQDLKGLFLSDDVSPEFVQHWLQHSEPDLAALATGTTVKGLRVTALRRLPLLLPPFPEQKKIAAILSSVDYATAATRKVIEQTEQVKKGLLQTLMTRGIGHTRFKKTEIGEIPEEWQVVPGERLFKLYSGQTPAVLEPFEAGSSALYLKVSDFNDPSNTDGLRVAALGFSGEDERVRIHDPGAIVFPKRGAAIFQERALILREPGTVDPNLMVMVSLGPVPDFLRHFLLYRGMGTLCEDGGIPQINNKHLYPLSFPVPPKGEQREIVTRLGAVEASSRNGAEALAHLQTLKRGLLQDLLTGRVRVTPD